MPSVPPQPDTIVHYHNETSFSSSEQESSNKAKGSSALYLFGDPSSPRMALCCAGFPDDHTVFRPFAKSLSEKGILVGVMCLPGYDDRPADGVPWTEHNPSGYTFDEMVSSIRAAARALRAASKAPEDKPAALTGIFHDWGVVPATMWAQRLEEEEKDKADKSQPPTLDRIVFFDVLMPPPLDRVQGKYNPVEGFTALEAAITVLYKVILGLAFWLRANCSEYLAIVFFLCTVFVLKGLRLDPLYSFDENSPKALYKNNVGHSNSEGMSLSRIIYMSYPYWNLMRKMGMLAGRVHSNWKDTPILYLYGPNKRTQFHHKQTLRLLEREAKESRSISQAVAISGTGHYLYLQEQERCLELVFRFMTAEK